MQTLNDLFSFYFLFIYILFSISYIYIVFFVLSYIAFKNCWAAAS